jgi:high affinity sulfate transporter 1
LRDRAVEGVTEGRAADATATSMPVLSWITSYRRSDLRFDVLAGGAVWALVVPQSVAYATLAGVPVEHGLYAMVVALFAYAVFGPSSRVIAGISATTVALTPLVIAFVIDADGAALVAYSAAVSLAVGCILLAMGVFRMGWIANFLSAPVVAGFITGFGISLAIDQLPKLLGYEADTDGAIRQLWLIVRHLDETQGATLVVGATALVVLFGLRRTLPQAPGALIVAVLGIVAASLLDLGAHGVELVGEIPSGLPTFGLPDIDWSLFPALLLASTAMTVVALSEAVGAAEAVARRHGERLDLNREFIANGLANVGSCFATGLVVNGSLSKTAANETAGGRTPMTSVVAGTLGLVTVLFLTGVFADLPDAVLGAIVFQAATSLIDFRALRAAARIQRNDVLAAAAALLATLAFGILTGMLVGIALSLLLLIRYASETNLRVLGQNSLTGQFQRLDRHPDNVTFAGILVTRIDGSVFFTSSTRLMSGIRELVAAEPPRAVIIDLEGAKLFDTTAIQALQDLHDELDLIAVELHLTCVHADTTDVFRRAGGAFALQSDRMHPSIGDALRALGAVPSGTTSLSDDKVRPRMNPESVP